MVLPRKAIRSLNLLPKFTEVEEDENDSSDEAKRLDQSTTFSLLNLREDKLVVFFEKL